MSILLRKVETQNYPDITSHHAGICSRNPMMNGLFLAILETHNGPKSTFSKKNKPARSRTRGDEEKRKRGREREREK